MPESLITEIRRRVLLGDGAMGTQLQLAGLAPGECGEAWNLTHPERVLAIQQAYVAAGSDCLITNTFGASRLNLDRHDQGKNTLAINRAGAELARKAFGKQPGFVLGDIGPFGGMMEPLGDIPTTDVFNTFYEQARALVDAGVDALIIETQTYTDELQQAVDAARKAGASLVIASLSFDVGQNDDLHTMMGVSPEDAATFAKSGQFDVLALNCGRGMDMPHAARVIQRFRSNCSLPTMAQPNAGTPVLLDGKIAYKQSPEEMAAGLNDLLAAGVNIVGACCGSTPAHIAAMRPLVDAHNRATSPTG